MSRAVLASLVFCFVAGVSAATAPEWGQCGGQGWTGATTCPNGWSCTATNQFYSQCLQGAAAPAPSSTVATSAPAGSAPAGGSPTSTAAAGATPTLISGNSFIRAVEDPNFHKYLRSQTATTVGPAVLGEPVDAAQFQISGGQLMQVAPGGTTLFANVEPAADSTVKKLAVSWKTTPDTLGTFVWGGDTVEWSSTTVTRPQNNAWLICPDADGNKLLFVNLGAYSYMTPAGCADETIHAYTGATPTA